MSNTLTQNIAAEGSVLGSMLLDRKTISPVQEILPDKFHFVKPEHQILYEAILEIYSNTPCSEDGWDLVLIRDALIQNRKLDAVGGIEYLIKLAETTPTTANAEYYAACVRSAYYRRKILEMGRNLNAAATEAVSPQEVFNETLKDFRELATEITDTKERIEASKAVENLIDETLSGRRTVVQLPWRCLSSLTKAIQPGTVTLLCGTPGASKSFASLEILSKANEDGQPAAYFALEDSKAFHLMRLLAQRTNISGLTDPNWITENPILVRAAVDEYRDWLNQIGRRIQTCNTKQAIYAELLRWCFAQAQDGVKLLIIDPITAIHRVGRQGWIEDNDFLQHVKRLLTDYSAALILVTHPTKTNGDPSMEMLAGGAAFSRFAQTILWLEYHEVKNSSAITACGTAATAHNRTMHVLKARLGKGQGARVAMTFTDGLQLTEHGAIVKKKKQTQKDDEE